MSPTTTLMHAWSWFLGLDAGMFLTGLGVLLAVWAGYPALLWVRARRRALPAPPRPTRLPFFSLIIAAHNEADAIGARLDNALQLDYPAERLEILVVDDGSEDGTADCVRARDSGRVRLLSYAQRQGKATALNLAVQQARGEVLLFSDASNLYSADALLRMAEPFADAAVGAAVGNKQVATLAGVGGGESVYWNYENRLLRLEDETGTVVAGSGEILALRRELYHALPAQVMVNDDLFQILQVVSRGRRVAFAAGARSYEQPSAHTRDEWERRSRMAAGRWQALQLLRPELLSLRGLRRLKVWCHCRLRPLSALWMSLALLSSPPLVLSSQIPAWIAALAWMQFGLYLLAGLAAISRRFHHAWGKGEALYFFFLAQFACLNGWRRHLTGQQAAAWERTRRSLSAAADPDVNRRTVASGMVWAYSSFALGKLLVFATTMLLARLLAPNDFGEVAIVLSALSLLETLGSLGLASAVIFEPRDAEAAANLGFWLLLPTSLLTIALAWAAAPPAAAFFHAPPVAPMLRVLSFSLLCSAFSSSPDALMRRQLAFRRKMLPDFTQSLIKGLSSVLLALLGLGAWSLIWGQLLGGIVYAAALWLLLDWHPHWGWSGELARRMLRYARHIYLMELCGTLLLNLDAFIIARMLGKVALGYYTLAYRIPDLALLNLIYIASRVVFPALSRLQSDMTALRRALLATMRYSSLLTVPIATGLLITAGPLVIIAYGWNWLPSISVLRILALYALVRAASHHFGDAYKAMGRPEILSRFTVLWMLLLPPSLIAGARWNGIYGVACALLLARTLMTLLHFVISVRVVRLRPAELLAALRPAAEASLFMAALLVPEAYLISGWAPKLQLPVLALTGAAGYMFWLQARHRGLLQQIRQLAAAPATAALPLPGGAGVTAAVPTLTAAPAITPAAPAAITPAPLASFGSET